MKVPRVARVALVAAASALAFPAVSAAAFPYDPLAYSRLTDPGDNYDWQPAWSHDGSRVAFVRNTPVPGSYYNDLFVTQSDGSGLAKLTTNENIGAPSWSPDGRKLVFADALTSEPVGYDTHIFAVDADGSNRVDLTPAGAGTSFRAPAWSPDGARVAYVLGTGGIWTMRPDGSDKTQLTTNGSFPAWSHNGSKLSFIVDKTIRVMDADGSGVRDVTTAAGSISGPAAWSRDGSKLVYAFYGTKSSDVWVVNTDGTGRTQLTKTDTISENEPSFSPAADALLMSANRDGAGSIYAARTAPPPPPPPPPVVDPPPPAATPAPCAPAARADGRPVGASINASVQYTNKTAATLTVVAPDAATSVLLSNDGGFGQTRTVAVQPSERYSWTLAGSGPERLPKTVYVRFAGPCVDGSQTFTDDIILDQTPPAVSAAGVSPQRSAGRSAAVARSRMFRLRLRATDKTSGVAKAQAAVNKRKPLKASAYRTMLRLRSPQVPRWVRVSDRAGNWSAWKKVAR